MNESLPIQWSGYPLYPCDPPGDYAKDPCVWYWYKDPGEIPERHWRRYGAVKPKRDSKNSLEGAASVLEAAMSGPAPCCAN